MKKSVLATAGLLAPLPIWAQAAPAPITPSPVTAATADGAVGTDPAATAGDMQPGDIVVTAQRREQSLQRTPLAITAIAGGALQEQGIRNPVDLAVRVPSLQIGTSGQVYLRGVGTANVNEASDPTVATHIDGVYLARPQGVLAAGFYDIDRVEVLRGPQGTLYGRNATAGSINIISNSPKFEDSGSASVEIGNYDTLTSSGYINLAATDQLAFRASFQTVRHDGYLESQARQHPDGDSADNKSLRLQGLYNNGAGLRVLLRGDLTIDNGTTNIYGSEKREIGQVRDRDIDSQTYPASNGSKYGGASLEVDLDAGPGTITYLSGYRFAKEHRQSEYLPFGGAALFNNDDRTIQQELRYAGSVGPAKFISGVFYFNELNKVDSRFQSGDTYYTFLQNPTKAESVAVYGQATVSIVPVLRLTGGLRYTHDTKSRDGVGLLQDTDFVTLSQFATNTASGSWSKVNWKAGVEYDAAQRVLLYANVSTGYKAGGYFDGVGPNNTFAPEEVQAYEAGIKSRLLNGRLTLNLDAFYYDYTNLQVSTYADVTGSGAQSQVTLNAGKARSYGVEGELVGVLSATDRIDAQVGYLNARYTDFYLLGGDQFSGAGITADYTGNRLAKSPAVTLNGGYQHDVAFGAGLLNFRIQTHYESSKYLDYHNFAVTRQNPFTRTDIIVTYRPTSSRWSLSAYLRNIEGKRPWIDLIPRTATIADGNVAPPRLIGGRLTYNF